ncbi:MAG: prepilin-type N-terminal cleavage/methylation domain-containing protein [Planctomycetota bacterium]
MSKRNKTGFTIVELLTVMSIIIIIMSILVPALSGARKFASRLKQKAQFYEISKGLEDFEKATGAYPDSDALDVNNDPYCGAMRLCEAMMGQDGMGFHPDSGFLASAGLDTQTTLTKYPFDLCNRWTVAYTADQLTNLRYRDSGRYLDIENVKAYRLEDVYGNGGIAPFGADETLYPNSVISDVFLRPTIVNTTCDSDLVGEKVGMPVLYYKADTSMVDHIANSSLVNYPYNNIYRYTDNDNLTALGLPWEPIASRTTLHPLYSGSDTIAGNDVGTTFYQETINKRVTATPRPHNEGKYILISAGWDGLYGTSDDVFNFTD